MSVSLVAGDFAVFDRASGRGWQEHFVEGRRPEQRRTGIVDAMKAPMLWRGGLRKDDVARQGASEA